jgi:hypothetical protein
LPGRGAGVAPLFALLLVGPFVLLLVGPFVLLVAVAVAAELVALAGAILATPYLLIRHVRTRIASRHWGSDWGIPRMRVARLLGNPRHRHQTEGMS